MISLFRLIYRSLFVKGLPLHQALVGILLIPIGGAISWAALYADPNAYYPYFVVFGVVFAIFGVVLIIKGFLGFSVSKTSRPVQASNAYNGQAQYPQQYHAYTAPAQYSQQPQVDPYAGPAQYSPQTQVPYTAPAQYSQPTQE